jgi:hypothetical protein
MEEEEAVAEGMDVLFACVYKEEGREGEIGSGGGSRGDGLVGGEERKGTAAVEGADEEEGERGDGVRGGGDDVEGEEGAPSVGGMEGVGKVAGEAGEGRRGGRGVVVRVESESRVLCVEGMGETKEGGTEGGTAVSPAMGVEEVEGEGGAEAGGGGGGRCCCNCTLFEGETNNASSLAGFGEGEEGATGERGTGSSAAAG